MHGKPWRTVVVVLLTIAFCAPALSEEGLTDGEKKQIIYKMYEDYKKSFPEAEDVTPQEAMALMKSSKVLFVDTREAKEQKVSMLPGAMTEEEFEKHLDAYKDRVIIGYCTISYRSGKLAARLRKKGITMFNLKGGLLGWIHEGGKVYDAKGETKRIHVYSQKWNYVPAGYEAVW